MTKIKNVKHFYIYALSVDLYRAKLTTRSDNLSARAKFLKSGVWGSVRGEYPYFGGTEVP